MADNKGDTQLVLRRQKLRSKCREFVKNSNDQQSDQQRNETITNESKTCNTEKAGLLRMYQTFGVKLLTFKLRHSNDCRALIGLAVSRERLFSHPGIFAYA